MRQLRLAGGNVFAGVNLYGATLTVDMDATYADGGSRAAEGFRGAHEGCVVAVKGKDG